MLIYLIYFNLIAEQNYFSEFNLLHKSLTRFFFEPFPFGLLTMIVSLEAIFLSYFVLIPQNRQAVKDHLRSDVEYEVNIKAEMEITHLHEKTDQMNEHLLEHFARLESQLSKNF